MYEYANEANIMGNKHATGFCLVVDLRLKTFGNIKSLKLIKEKMFLDKEYPFFLNICENMCDIRNV